jgi:hypothetical protein
MSELKLVRKEELALIENNAFTEKQMQHLLKKTPEKYIKKRPAKGGGQWEFVTGGYVKKCLNLMFGFDWDFEVIKFEIIGKQAIVLGKLTCRSGNKTIVKQQFGRQDIKYRKDTNEPMDLGNDLKGATTDSLKKCASEIGIASDIYNKEEFESAFIVSEEQEEKLLSVLKDLQVEKGGLISDQMKPRIKEIIDNKEVTSYLKAKQYLTDLK